MTWRAEDPIGNEAAKCRYDVIPYFGNANLDLGCGPWKVWPNFVGVDNGLDTELFKIEMRPDVVVGTCERLPIFASGSIDCVFSSHLLEHLVDYKSALAEWWRLVKPGGHLVLYLPHADLYPNIGQPGANPDHKHDFRPEDIVAAMTEVGHDWDLVENQVRKELAEYSFFQVYKKLHAADFVAMSDAPLESWRNPKPEKTVAIVRPGAYGDAIWAGALAHEFKRQGYNVTLYTGPVGREVSRANPNIDRIITMPNGMLGDDELLLFFLWEGRKYSRFVNLIGAVEGRLLPHPNEIQFYWPQEIRHARMNANYLERLFELAGLPMPATLEQRFHPDPREAAWAREQRDANFGDGKLVVLCPTGSGGPKTWPHVQRFLELMAAVGVYVVVLGELRYELDPPEKYGVVIGKELPMRNAMALAQVADCVVGSETGILNAVASCEMPKVALLSHSSRENLTKHWRNAITIEPHNVACHPCHRLHRAFEFCPRDATTKWSACQTAISADKVAELVLRALGSNMQKAA